MLRSALLLSLLAGPALAFEASNGLHVSGSESRIVVAATPGQAPSQSWCAAGDFVVRALGLPLATPVYRLTEPPRKPMQAIEFSLSGEGAASRSGVFQLGQNDAMMSAGQAQSLCAYGYFRL